MRVVVFVNCDTGNMSAYASLEAFSRHHPEWKAETRNGQGDLIVEAPREPFPKYVGYLQEVPVTS